MPDRDPIDDADRARRFAGIRQWGDPVLRDPTRTVERFDDALAGQARQMLEIMERANGAGLAAPQVGIAQRLLVYRHEPAEEPTTLVNAVLAARSEETERGLEGCLSIGFSTIAVDVERALAVTVEAQRLDGTPVTIEAEGLHARVLQHEIDHLDGVLMLDRIDPGQRREALRALREGRPWAPEPPPEDDAAVS